jgi:hypothetical protein
MTEHIQSRHHNIQSTHTAFNSAMYRTFKEDMEMQLAARAASDVLNAAFGGKNGRGDEFLIRLLRRSG